MRFLAVLTVRNEGAFLLEWLAHHRAVGFTDFLVLSNDCDDGTDLMLDRLQAMGIITHMRNDGPHEGGIQFAGLKRADKHPLVRKAGWIMALDIDEFVNIHTGAHRLPDLLAALPEATAIALTWRLFGNCGIVRFEDRPITGQFTRAAPAILHWPWRAAMFKTLFRNDGIYRKLGVHRPRSPDHARLNEARWFDGSGRMLGERFRRQRTFSDFGQDNYALAQLNHYPLGAMESFIVKRDRGRAVHEGEALGMSYWCERNWCTQEDTTIAALEAERHAQITQLMADEELGRLHAAAVGWRKARFESLMAQEQTRALFGRLLMAPPARPIAPDALQHLLRFTQSPASKQD